MEDSDGYEDDYEDNYYGGFDGGDDYHGGFYGGDDYHGGSVFEEEYNGKSDVHGGSHVDYDFSPSSKGYSEVMPNIYRESSNAYGNDITLRQSYNQQCTIRNNIVEKQTGSYVRTTKRDTCSSGDVFKERSTGRIGYKDEYKTTTTVKVGDKRGYSEYQTEEKFRRVDYGISSAGGSRGKSSYSSNKYLK
ncbi:uncharacterized protein LOC126669885 [Mercurialis annua]|uniref:uncharacterized protein LOC126669885 n=1 Tax=Mercurialis annua TaxID=3986 RepID=UPI00215ECCF9|nr:uncharacterized protein LOC126669885 [Mercurialis annua]